LFAVRAGSHAGGAPTNAERSSEATSAAVVIVIVASTLPMLRITITPAEYWRERARARERAGAAAVRSRRIAAAPVPTRRRTVTTGLTGLAARSVRAGSSFPVFHPDFSSRGKTHTPRSRDSMSGALSSAWERPGGVTGGEWLWPFSSAPFATRNTQQLLNTTAPEAWTAAR
jgi:hypothetical protein